MINDFRQKTQIPKMGLNQPRHQECRSETEYSNNPQVHDSSLKYSCCLKVTIYSTEAT